MTKLKIAAIVEKYCLNCTFLVKIILKAAKDALSDTGYILAAHFEIMIFNHIFVYNIYIFYKRLNAFQYLVQEYKKKIENVYLFKQIRPIKFFKFLGHKSLNFQIWTTWIKILLDSY